MWVTSTWSFVGTHPESNLGHHNDRWMVTYPRGPLASQKQLSGETEIGRPSTYPSASPNSAEP